MIGGTSGAGPATQGAGLESSNHLQFHATPTVNPVVPNRPAISGTGAAHPRSGPAVVGGPARTVVGISGTAIRPKHWSIGHPGFAGSTAEHSVSSSKRW